MIRRRDVAIVAPITSADRRLRHRVLISAVGMPKEEAAGYEEILTEMGRSVGWRSRDATSNQFSARVDGMRRHTIRRTRWLFTHPWQRPSSVACARNTNPNVGNHGLPTRDRTNARMRTCCCGDRAASARARPGTSKKTDSSRAAAAKVG